MHRSKSGRKNSAEPTLRKQSQRKGLSDCYVYRLSQSVIDIKFETILPFSPSVWRSGESKSSARILNRRDSFRFIDDETRFHKPANILGNPGYANSGVFRQIATKPTHIDMGYIRSKFSF